jgi:putative ABC transport system ATP-binding protein
MTGPLLKAENLSRVYRLGEEKVVGVQDATFSIEPGEFAVLAGPSGSGKTTLLNLLGLLDTPDSGRILFEGSDASSLDESARARLRREKLGFVFQAHQLIPVLSAEENVAFALWLRELPEEECRTRARRALRDVGLEGMEGRRPGALSGGQRQRVAVARALVGEPALILADEPTASLDSTTSVRLLDLFVELHRSRGVAFLFSSHDPRIIERARRRIELLDGRIVSDVTSSPADTIPSTPVDPPGTRSARGGGGAS